MAAANVPERRRRAETWSDSETNALISLWSVYRDELKNAKRNRSVYETMASLFNEENNFSRSWVELKTKISNLTTDYRREKLKESMGTPTKWRFWMQVNSVLSSELTSDEVILPDNAEIPEPQSNVINTSGAIDAKPLFSNYNPAEDRLMNGQVPVLSCKRKSKPNGLPVHETVQQPPSKKRRQPQEENTEFSDLVKDLLQQQKIFHEEQQKSDEKFLNLVQETVNLHSSSLMLQEKIFETLTTLRNDRNNTNKSFEKQPNGCNDSKYLDVLKELVQQQNEYREDQQQNDASFANSMQETLTLQEKSFSLQEKMLTMLKEVPKK